MAKTKGNKGPYSMWELAGYLKSFRGRLAGGFILLMAANALAISTRRLSPPDKLMPTLVRT